MSNIFPAILIFFLILLGLTASCFFGCARLKNQVVRILLGILGVLMALFLCFCLMFCYITMVHVTTIDSSSSPDGKYSVVFQEKGQSFGFGPAACRLILKKGKKIVAKESFLIANDGKVITEERWTVSWKPDHVIVAINGEEQPDREYDLCFDGTTGHRYTKSWMARDRRSMKGALKNPAIQNLWLYEKNAVICRKIINHIIEAAQEGGRSDLWSQGRPLFLFPFFRKSSSDCREQIYLSTSSSFIPSAVAM